MKTIFTCLSVLPLLTLPILAETAPAVPAEKVAQNKMIIKLGLSLSEVESILSKQALSLKRWTPPVSAVVHYEPKDSFAASLHLWEGKAGYFLHFEWDEDRQCHLLDSIELSADLDALLENYNSKASEEVEEPCRPRHVKTIVFDPDSLRQDIERYKEDLAGHLKDTRELLTGMRQTPTRGRIAKELRSVMHLYLVNCPYNYYEEYNEQEKKLIEELAAIRYASDEEQEALWQNALKANAELQHDYPRSARALPSLIELLDSLYQEQCQIPTQQRAENAAAYQREVDELVQANGLPLFRQLPASVQDFAREYLCAMLLAEADVFEKASDTEEASYLLVKEGVKILQNLDTSTLPEGYQEIVEKHTKQMELFLSSCKDGKINDDMELLPDAYRMGFEQIEENLDEMVAKLNDQEPKKKEMIAPPQLPESFIRFMDHSILLHCILEHDDLKDYYYYLLESNTRNKKSGLKMFAAANLVIAEKIKNK